MRRESFIICVRFSSLILNQDITFAGNLIYNLNLKFKSYLDMCVTSNEKHLLSPSLLRYRKPESKPESKPDFKQIFQF